MPRPEKHEITPDRTHQRDAHTTDNISSAGAHLLKDQQVQKSVNELAKATEQHTSQQHLPDVTIYDPSLPGIGDPSAALGPAAAKAQTSNKDAHSQGAGDVPVELANLFKDNLPPQIEALFKQQTGDADTVSERKIGYPGEEVTKKFDQIALDIKRALLDKEDPAENLKSVRGVLQALENNPYKRDQVLAQLEMIFPGHIAVELDGSGNIDRISYVETLPRTSTSIVQDLYQKNDSRTVADSG